MPRRKFPARLNLNPCSHDQSHYRMVAAQSLHRLLQRGDPHRAGCARRLSHPRRRHPRPERKPGGRLCRLAGPQPARSRGSSHLSALRQFAGPRRRENRPGQLHVRLFPRHHYFRGQHRQLLRPFTRTRAIKLSRRRPARRRAAKTWPRRHRLGLGL